VPIHKGLLGTAKFPEHKVGIFRKVKEIKGLRGGDLEVAAQGIPRIDAEIAEKGHLWMETDKGPGPQTPIRPEKGDVVMPDKSPLEGKKILAVDDEEDILSSLEELLPMCELAAAATFEEARELMTTRDFDLAVLDIMGVDGYRLLELAVARGIPAVMLTAHAFAPEHLMRSIKKGAVSYLPKEELPNIEVFLGDVFKDQEQGRNPWVSWREKLPTSYFEKRWGAAWQDTDREFWDRFKASLKERKSKDK